ncbi:lipopolysaccharide-induced tumor necrosis factor-alpha factor homolog [Leptodactylus fuscus]|uniref:lipopolysaccharide-induced tumor necrosis factor-alpha factor homolog n=1 Tax=Leptodactylus fuscus TaxID=238119 RepID=UPI003F4EF9DB
MVGTTFADTPASCTCPVCRQQIVSRIEYKNGLLVWALFGTLLFLGCWLGCCLIPFCMDSCKDVDHYCPSCNHHLSKYKKL